MKRRAVGLFAKPVSPGAVKTRLTPTLSPGQAAALYGAFLADLTNTLAGQSGFTWSIFSTDPEAQRKTWPAEAAPAPAIHGQSGPDLGARMHAAFETLLREGTESAILIGSDHPTLDARTLEEAFSLLESADVVLGPSLDGGYFLVGLNEPHAELFHRMTWSSPDVFAITLERIEKAELKPAFLDPWYDVDLAADLTFLRLHLKALTMQWGDAAPCPRTRAVLQNL